MAERSHAKRWFDANNEIKSCMETRDAEKMVLTIPTPNHEDTQILYGVDDCSRIFCGSTENRHSAYYDNRGVLYKHDGFGREKANYQNYYEIPRNFFVSHGATFMLKSVSKMSEHDSRDVLLGKNSTLIVKEISRSSTIPNAVFVLPNLHIDIMPHAFCCIDMDMTESQQKIDIPCLHRKSMCCIFIRDGAQCRLEEAGNMPYLIAYNRSMLNIERNPMRAFCTILTCLVIISKNLLQHIPRHAIEVRIREVTYLLFDHPTHDYGRFGEIFKAFKRDCNQIWMQCEEAPIPSNVMAMLPSWNMQETGVFALRRCMHRLFPNSQIERYFPSRASIGVRGRDFIGVSTQPRVRRSLLSRSSQSSSRTRRDLTPEMNRIHESAFRRERSSSIVDRVSALEAENAELRNQIMQIHSTLQRMNNSFLPSRLMPFARYSDARFGQPRFNDFPARDAGFQFFRFAQPHGIYENMRSVFEEIRTQIDEDDDIERIAEFIDRHENPHQPTRPSVAQDSGIDVVTEQHLKTALRLMDDNAGLTRDEQEQATNSVSNFLDLIKLPDCQICCSVPVDCIILPCCHMAACYQCINRYTREICCICRGQNTNIVKFNMEDDNENENEKEERATRPSSEPATQEHNSF